MGMRIRGARLFFPRPAGIALSEGSGLTLQRGKKPGGAGRTHQPAESLQCIQKTLCRSRVIVFARREKQHRTTEKRLPCSGAARVRQSRITEKTQSQHIIRESLRAPGGAAPARARTSGSAAGG